jgi:hypothetical protein
MPRVIPYNDVSERMRAQGFVSLYHNSGAFGFPPGAAVHNFGWIGPEDPTIRAAARAFVRQAAAPHEETLARMLVDVWTRHLGGEAWLMPKSHWHYELQFGNRELLELMLEKLGIDPGRLRDENNGAAIEFGAGERELLGETAKRLLGGLAGSDFLVAFPGRATVCTIHHHKQLWWQTTDAAVAAGLDGMRGGGGGGGAV